MREERGLNERETITRALTQQVTIMLWTVYLSGEIHSDWRNQIIQAVEKLDLSIEFTSAVTDHEASDAAGDHLGEETEPFWRDHKSAKINTIRTKNLIEQATKKISWKRGKSDEQEAKKEEEAPGGATSPAAEAGRSL